jgi:hypothetical protein
MTAIFKAEDGRLPRRRGTGMKVGSGPTLATEATPGSAGGQLVVPLHGFSNPVRKPATAPPGAAPPPMAPAIPPEVGPAAFDYAALEPGDAEFLRKEAARSDTSLSSEVFTRPQSDRCPTASSRHFCVK